MYNDTVTLFNKYTDEAGEIYWYPHVLSSVDFLIVKAAKVAKTGTDSADTAELHIRYVAKNSQKMIGDIQWLPPKKWKEQQNPSETITFSAGDFFVSGKYETPPVKDSDYRTRVNGGFYDYMNKSQDFVFLVTSAEIYTLIPHFEIGGK